MLGLAEAGPGEVVDEAALPRFLARHCVAQHPEAGQLYEELQAVANLPLEPAMQAGPAAEAAWVALLMNTRRSERQKLMLREQEVQLASLQQQAEESRAALERIGQDVEHKQKALRDFEAKTAELAQEAERLRASVAEHAEIKEENDLLLAQLHQVQEELERTFLEKANLDKTLLAAKANERSALEKLQAAEKAEKDGASRLAALKHEIEAVRAEGGQLKDALAKTTTEQQDTLEENDLLLAQLHSVQEELEQQFLACQNSERSLSASEAQIKGLNAELDRLRTQQAKHAEISEENELLLMQLHQVQEELERLFLSAQSREKLVEELRGELARHAEATKEKEQLLARLHKAQEALEAAYLGRKSLPTTQARKDARLLGAAERVKQQLTYRLGATMIENSRSPGGWITMPFALLGTARKFRADVRARGETKLPPISRYHDRHEAARLQQHLSYRLGATLLRNIKSPVGWVRLPFALRREVKAFRAERKGGKQR